MHEPGLRTGDRHEGGIHLVGAQQSDAGVPDLLGLAHGHPDVGVDEVRARDSLLDRLGQGDAGAGGLGDLAGRLDARVVGPQLLGRHDARVGAEQRAVDEQRAPHVEAGVADVGVGDLAGGLARVLQHGQGVAEHLGGVPLVGQPVPHRHAGELGQGPHLGLGVATVLDAVEHAPQDPSGVRHGLLVPHLGARRVEVGGAGALVRRADLEGAAGARGGLLEDEGDIPAGQALDLAAGLLGRLELGGQLDEGHPLLGGEVELAQEAAALEAGEDDGIGSGQGEGGHAGPFSAVNRKGEVEQEDRMAWRAHHHVLRPRRLGNGSTRQHGAGKGQDSLKSNSGWLLDHSVTASSSLPSP